MQSTAGSIEMQRARNEEISDAQQLPDAAHEQRLESTSMIGTTESTALSAGAIVGIVIGIVVVVIAVIVTIILVRYYLCFCFDRRKALSNDFTVSYTRSELALCDSSTNSDPKTLVPTELDNCGFEGMKNISPDVTYAEREFTTERRGTELSDGEKCLNDKSRTEASQTLDTGNENRVSSADNQSASTVAEMATAMPSNDSSHLDFKHSRHISSASLVNLDQNDRGMYVRRSYHVDRSMASAIAAQKNRETSVLSVFGDSNLTNSEQDVVIVYRARTAL